MTSENPYQDEAPVLVRYPRSRAEEQADRGTWPWLPGTIVQRCGEDEWQVCVEDMSVAVRMDGSKPTPRTPDRNLFYPCCFRDRSEIRPRED